MSLVLEVMKRWPILATWQSRQVVAENVDVNCRVETIRVLESVTGFEEQNLIIQLVLIARNVNWSVQNQDQKVVRIHVQYKSVILANVPIVFQSSR